MKRRHTISHDLLRFGWLSAALFPALFLALPLTSRSVAQHPIVNSGPAEVALSASRGTASGHSEARAGSASAPTLQPHLRSHIGLYLGLGGRWWDDAATIKSLRLSPEQHGRMDSIFETNRPTLMALYLNMQREQSHLSSLSPSELQDQSTVFAAIDRVSQARCSLEKENARILIEIRRQMDADQLSTLDREISAVK